MVEERFEVDSYFETARRHSGLARASLDADDLLGRAARGVRDVLRRLEALPRVDRFWRSTNHATTIYKASDYAWQLVGRDPKDVQAWWCLVGMDLWHCQNDFGSRGFSGLHALGLLEAEWPVRAAYSVFASSGFDPTPILLDLVTRLGIEREAREALAVLAGGHANYQRAWANGVLKHLEAKP